MDFICESVNQTAVLKSVQFGIIFAKQETCTQCVHFLSIKSLNERSLNPPFRDFTSTCKSLGRQLVIFMNLLVFKTSEDEESNRFFTFENQARV